MLTWSFQSQLDQFCDGSTDLGASSAARNSARRLQRCLDSLILLFRNNFLHDEDAPVLLFSDGAIGVNTLIPSSSTSVSSEKAGKEAEGALRELVKMAEELLGKLNQFPEFEEYEKGLVGAMEQMIEDLNARF